MIIGLAAALVLILGTAWWAGTRRVQRALAGDAEGAVRELCRALSRVGVTIRAGMTLAELELQLELSHGAAASRYVGLLIQRRYAAEADPGLPSPRDRRVLRRALYAGSGPVTRARVLLALLPGTRRPFLRRVPRGL